MSKIAFIFPGQGAQTCGMGKDFYEQTETGRKVFDKATELLGFSVPELCFEPNDRLDITELINPVLVVEGRIHPLPQGIQDKYDHRRLFHDLDRVLRAPRCLLLSGSMAFLPSPAGFRPETPSACLLLPVPE